MPKSSVTENIATHTPGPWTHAPLSDDVIGPRGHGVCSPCEGYDEEQWPIDARLISAAPDLLAALKATAKALEMAIRSNLSRHLDSTEEEYTAAVRSNVALIDAFAAIARAEGGAR